MRREGGERAVWGLGEGGSTELVCCRGGGVAVGGIGVAWIWKYPREEPAFGAYVAGAITLREMAS